jgi:alpha-galactosidase
MSTLILYRPLLLAAFTVFVLAGNHSRAKDTLALSSLDLTKIQQGYGAPQANLSVAGHPLTIGGQTFKTGVGTHAISSFVIDLKKTADTFTASVGVDDDAGDPRGSVEFIVYGDTKVLWQSGVMKTGTAPKKVEVSLQGVKTLKLSVQDADDGIDYDHADWADAQIGYSGAAPVAININDALVLTPPSPATPQIHGAKVFGTHPTNPFLFTIAATGDRPMTFSADNLPAGLKLDSATGQIIGTSPAAGDYTVILHAKNERGETKRDLLIKAGDKIGLTPQMGWNSWNCFASAVTEDRIRSAADAMVKSGLANHGWTYINVDDFWQVNPSSGDATLHGPERNADGTIHPNPRFPNMKGMADYIHAKGLKAGLYSSPGPYTCGGCTASYQHEDQDAQTYADWGFDYLKYDWCSYGGIYDKSDVKGVDGMKKPYQVMAGSIKKVKRDIFFSFCQYGMGDVWSWGDAVGGQSWRTTGDINDSWKSMIQNASRQDGIEKFAGPGHWNDPDMLVVGKVGWGPDLHPSRLTPDEQYTHISLWCLQAAPLLIGCDLTQMDDFTLGLLTNDEVNDVDQDPLGQAASLVSHMIITGASGTRETQVWARPLEDGSTAVGLFNYGLEPITVTAQWADLKITGARKVRDLWRQKDLGTSDDKFESEVPPHGVVFVRLIKP